MKKQEYLDKLELELRRQNITQLSDILSDYREHFAVGLAKNKSEEEICEKLGDPSLIAKAYQAETVLAHFDNTTGQDQIGHFFKAVMRILILTPFNFFMLIGPFLVTVAMLIAGWAVTFSLGGTGVLIGVLLLFLLPFTIFSLWSGGAVLFSSLFLMSMSAVIFICMYFVTKMVMILFIKYVKWNVQFVKGSNV